MSGGMKCLGMRFGESLLRSIMMASVWYFFKVESPCYEEIYQRFFKIYMRWDFI